MVGFAKFNSSQLFSYLSCVAFLHPNSRFSFLFLDLLSNNLLITGESEAVEKITEAIDKANAQNQDKKNMLFSVRKSIGVCFSRRTFGVLRFWSSGFLYAYLEQAVLVVCPRAACQVYAEIRKGIRFSHKLIGRLLMFV